MPFFPPNFKMFAVIQRGSTLAFCYTWEKQRMRSSNDLSESRKKRIQAEGKTRIYFFYICPIPSLDSI